MDLLTKHLLSGKPKIAKAMESQGIVSMSADDREQGHWRRNNDRSGLYVPPGSWDAATTSSGKKSMGDMMEKLLKGVEATNLGRKNGTLPSDTVKNPQNDGSCMAITTQSGKRLRRPSMGISLEDEVRVDEPKESNPVESEKLDSSIDDPEKENKKEEEVLVDKCSCNVSWYFKVAPKRKSPIELKKVAKDDARRKLIDEESDYEDKEPLLRKRKKQNTKKTSLIEVEDTNDTKWTIASEKEGSEKGDFEHADSDEGDQEESEESESEGTSSGPLSTEQ
ncbi:nucleolin-like [Capsicum annuum]|uniref:nucleolin-like n=1 Tax=Capsicum annuum TaxID=4072 RepID=UPI001FB119F8|nr:nucleolin-like [Capsicum annuum]